jgi:hypothetical protein
MGNLVLLMELVPKLEPRLDIKGLYRLAAKENLNFPEVKKVIGRHKFYDEDEVVEWYTLYKRATMNHKGPNKYGAYNGKRTER